MYEAKQPTRRPSSFREAEPILEKAHHLAEMGDGLKSADAFLGVSGSLIEWGYLDFVRDQVSRMMESVKADPLRKARCLWTLADIEDLRSEYPAALDLF